jgi:ABC-type Mn2+/Zn2+ transport system ATPase subunit
MRLYVNGFRCHQNKTLELPSTGFTLLSGPSGIGKSTYMEAIAWALHGKMSDVNNNNDPTSSCAVQLELSNEITIYRQKRPERLVVTVASSGATLPSVSGALPSSAVATLPSGSVTGVPSGSPVIYEDNVAQQIIDAAFGSRLAWQACCYLQQRNRNILLTGSNAEKMQVLNELSFSTEDPDLYIATIDNQLTQANIQFAGFQNQLVVDMNAFQRDITQYQPDMSRWCTDDVREAHNQELVRLQGGFGLLSQRLTQHRELSGQRNLLRQQRETIAGQLAGMRQRPTQEDTDRIEMLEAKLRYLAILPTLQAQERLRGQIRQAQQEMSSLSVPSEGLTGMSLKELNDRIYSQSQREIVIRSLNELGFDAIDPNLIITKITNLETSHREETLRLQQQKAFAAYVQVRTMLERTSVPPPITQEEIDGLTVSYNQAVKSQDVVTCPHCEGNLRWIDRKLCVATTAPTSQGRINELQTLITNGRRSLAQQVEVDRLRRSVSEHQDLLHRTGIDDIELWEKSSGIKRDHPDLIEASIRKHRTLLQQVKSYQTTYGTTPDVHTQKELRHAIAYETLRQRIEGLEAGVDPNLNGDFGPPGHNTLSSNPAVLRQEIETLRGVALKIQLLEQQHDTLQKQLDQARFTQLDQEIDPLVAYQESQNRITELQQTLMYCTTLQRFVDRQNEMMQRREYVLQLSQRVTDLQRLRAAAIDIECETLQSTVDVINATLNDVLEGIFDHPIRVTFSLFKALKSKAVDGSQRVKPIVNVVISHKGSDYDKLSKLSGGEGDRISLATTIALSRLSGCPFVMIDEAMSSIDGPLKEACIETLRDLVGPNKALYCVNHEVVEGHYDAVVKVEGS